ncbi:MAG: hypothetical protein ABIQ51_24710 [Mesorhizobium sp.]
MRLEAAAVLMVAFTVAGCASMKSDSGQGQTKVDIIRPEVTLSQLSSVPAAARHSDGGLPIKFRVRVSNRSMEEITLKNLTLVSMGRGAYDVEQTSRPFSMTVKPDGTDTADFWVPAVADSTILGANGPVTMRVIAHFDSPIGQFDEIVVQQVSGTAAANGPQ